MKTPGNKYTIYIPRELREEWDRTCAGRNLSALLQDAMRKEIKNARHRRLLERQMDAMEARA